MFLIAVTGGIACGKTKVCEVFQKYYDIAVVNADVISRESKSNSKHRINYIYIF